MPNLNEQLLAELLPCPCCASKNIEVCSKGDEQKCAITCNDCGLTLSWYRPHAEQKARWNRRQHGSAAQAVDENAFVALFESVISQDPAAFTKVGETTYQVTRTELIELATRLAAPPVADAEGVKLAIEKLANEALNGCGSQSWVDEQVALILAALSRLNGEKK